MNTKRLSTTALVAMTMAGSVTGQTPGQRSSPADLVDALHAAFGKHAARAVHAKGIILQGSFTPDAGAAAITTAAHLQKTASKVTVRFSDFTGIPDIPDNSGLANPRGLAIKFELPDGSTTDIVGHSFDGFPTPTSDDFRVLLMAISTSGPDAAKPNDLDKFLEANPVAKTFLTTQKTPASYSSISYFGVNAFKFTNEKKQECFIRYQFIPDEGEKLLTPAESEKLSKDYLIDEIKTRVATPFRFKLYAQLAESTDKIEDPSIAWPVTRRKILLGIITIDRLAPNTATEDKALSFSPNNIPAGITTADPMLNFRSRAYPVSVKERQ